MVVPARFPRRCSRCAPTPITTLPNLGQPSLLRGDLGSPQREELADLGPVVHANDGTLQTGLIGMAYQYTF
jgi:hypothetical protein